MRIWEPRLIHSQLWIRLDSGLADFVRQVGQAWTRFCLVRIAGNARADRVLGSHGGSQIFVHTRTNFYEYGDEMNRGRISKYGTALGGDS